MWQWLHHLVESLTFVCCSISKDGQAALLLPSSKWEIWTLNHFRKQWKENIPRKKQMRKLWSGVPYGSRTLRIQAGILLRSLLIKETVRYAFDWSRLVIIFIILMKCLTQWGCGGVAHTNLKFQKASNIMVVKFLIAFIRECELGTCICTYWITCQNLFEVMKKKKLFEKCFGATHSKPPTLPLSVFPTLFLIQGFYYLLLRIIVL